MKTQKTEIIRVQSGLTISNLLDKLNQVTVKEFDTAKKSKEYQYYGKINNKKFDIRNVKYSLYSSGPSIQGEIEEKLGDETLLNINIDIEEHNSYANTILTLTILVIAVSATLFSLGNQAGKLIPLTIFGVMLIFASGYVMLIKQLIKSTRKDELKKFLEITESKLI